MTATATAPLRNRSRTTSLRTRLWALGTIIRVYDRSRARGSGRPVRRIFLSHKRTVAPPSRGGIVRHPPKCCQSARSQRHGGGGGEPLPYAKLTLGCRGGIHSRPGISEAHARTQARNRRDKIGGPDPRVRADPAAGEAFQPLKKQDFAQEARCDGGQAALEASIAISYEQRLG